jgi:hypothetical protein
VAGKRRPEYYAALEYLGEAQAALHEAADRLLVAECNANAGGEERLTREAAILRRAVEAEDDAVAQVITLFFTTVMELARGWSIFVFVIGCACMLAWLTIPPIWVGLTPEQLVQRKKHRILLVAGFRLRGRAYISAAVSGAIIGLASVLASSRAGAVVITCVGVVTAGLSYSAGRSSRV